MIPDDLGPAHDVDRCSLCNVKAAPFDRMWAAIRMAEAFAWARGARAQVQS